MMLLRPNRYTLLKTRVFVKGVDNIGQQLSVHKAVLLLLLFALCCLFSFVVV